MTSLINYSIRIFWGQVGPLARRGVGYAESAGVPITKATHKAINLLFNKHVVSSLFIWFVTRSKTDQLVGSALLAFAWEGLSKRIKETSRFPFIQNATLGFSPTKSDGKSPYGRLANYFDVAEQGRNLRLRMYQDNKETLEASLSATQDPDGYSGLNELLRHATEMQSGTSPRVEVVQEMHRVAGTQNSGSLEEQGSKAAEKLTEKIALIKKEIKALDTKIAMFSADEGSASSENSQTIQNIALIAFGIFGAGKLPFVGGIVQWLAAVTLGASLGIEAYYQVVKEDALAQ